MKTLAITISGAVSLGAYEAGVMFELLQALGEHNVATPADQIVIDVLTGASAGGMTAVILAQKLLFQSDRLGDPADNDLYLPWVRDIDLTGLLALRSDEAEKLSILSSDLVEAISTKYLTDSYRLGINMSSQGRHPAAAARIKIGLAMSNLNGIDYGLQLATGGAMPYTRFQDQVCVDVDSQDPDHDSRDFWEPLRNAAVACGAFPLAFRVKDLLRHISDYQDPEPLSIPATGMHFAYTDGGVFQNEPVALAKRLVDEIDNHRNDQRFYVFVAPGMRQSASNTFSAQSASTFFNYWNTGKTLITAVFNQARYRDLENVERINRRIDLFDRQASALADLLIAGTTKGLDLKPATDAILPGLFPGFAAGQPTPDVEGARGRLKMQFREEYQKIVDAVGVSSADAWIDAVCVLEAVAALGPKDQMRVFAITEDADKLAGDDLYAFGGFFDESYRQHDYDRGRQSVRDFIVWLNGTANSGLGPIQYSKAQTPISIDTSLDGLKVQSLPLDKRQQLRDRLHDRIHDFLEELGIGWVGREAVDMAFLNKFLNSALGL
jgi:hypothetical protein